MSSSSFSTDGTSGLANRLAAVFINFAIRSEFSVRAVLKGRVGVANGGELTSDLLLSVLLLLLGVKLDIVGFGEICSSRNFKLS